MGSQRADRRQDLASQVIPHSMSSQWHRVAATRPATSEGQHKPLRAVAAGVAAVAIVLAGLAVVQNSPPRAGGSLQSVPPAQQSTAPPTLGPPVLALANDDAADDGDKTSPAPYTMLFDGTPSSRFDPVSEDADGYTAGLQCGDEGCYKTGAGKREKYHVAKLAGADSDGSWSLCGRPEVKHDGQWGSICFRGFTQTDAEMFCKTMGLTGGTSRYNDGLKPTWDDTAITHSDLRGHVNQRSEFGQGTARDLPLQTDVPLIWMSEVQCAGDESNILDCPFGGRPGEGTLAQDKKQTWTDYATLVASECDASSQVGLCCDVSAFCPPRSSWTPDAIDYSHEGQMFMNMMRPEQTGPEIVANCKCDEGFYMVPSSVYSGRCTSCPPGSCSPTGSTNIDQCYCLEGYYKDGSGTGDCMKCPVNSCSKKGATSLDDCKCFEGFYMSNAQCIACPEGTTSQEGATSEAECNAFCGLPHSSDAGDNAQLVTAAATDVSTADQAMMQAMVPYIKAVKDERKAQAALVLAQAFVPPQAPYYAHIDGAWQYQGWTSLGSHSTHYLDRQSANCGGPMSAFKLDRSGGSIRYKYRCTRNIAFSGAFARHTSSEDDGDGRIEYLDRLNVQCPSDSAISYFKYQRTHGGHKQRYNFNCVRPSAGRVFDCGSYSTSWNHKGDRKRSVEYLDRHQVDCPGHRGVLQQFRLQRSGDSIRYSYRCCSVSGEADQRFQNRKAALVAANTREINRQNGIIAQAQAVQSTAKTLYESEVAKRTTAMASLNEGLSISTEDETKAHFESAKNRCQPRLMCLQSWCNRQAPSHPCEPWPSCYPHPCHPWPSCAAQLPSGGYENGRLQPLSRGSRNAEDVSNVLKSYDAAAGYLSDPSVGQVSDTVEGSTGAPAFEREFDQR